MTPTVPPVLLNWLPVGLIWGLLIAATALLIIALRRFVFSDSVCERLAAYFSRFLEADSVPSIRLASGLIMVLLVAHLEIKYADAGNFKEVIAGNEIFIGSLFAIGATRQTLQSFAARPPEPAATINAKKADVDVAGNAQFTTPTEPS